MKITIFEIIKFKKTVSNDAKNMLIYDIALTMIPDIGTIRGRRLIDVFGSAEEALRSEPEEIEQRTQIPSSAVRSISNHNVFPQAEAEIKFAERHGIEIIPITSERYPAMLRECCDAPLVLYVRGNIDFNKGHWLSIVGTRKITPYGRTTCDMLIDGIALSTSDCVIVSGLAYGTDITSHIAAMRNNLPTVAVMAHALNRVYPEKHTDYARQIIDSGGALVSEFHSRQEMSPSNFLRRNRIIAGLSGGTIIVESAARGGSLSTAHYALGYDREVMAVPGRIGNPMSEGTNMLIKKNKASIILNSQDITETLNWDIKYNVKKSEAIQSSMFNDLNPDEKKIMEVLRNSESLSIDDISIKTDFPSYVVSAQLFSLEMKNLIRMRPGNMAEIIL